MTTPPRQSKLKDQRLKIADALMTPNQNYKGMKKIPIELIWAIEQLVTNVRLETFKEASDRLDNLHQGTEGAGWVHYGEMGEWLDEQINQAENQLRQAAKEKYGG